MSQDCSLRLGTHGQGFVVKCRKGRPQNEAFISHLRKKVFLPTVLKIALKTDLCPIKNLLSQYTKIYGIHRIKRDLSNGTKGLLNQFSDEQLHQLLEELKFDVLDENFVCDKIQKCE